MASTIFLIVIATFSLVLGVLMGVVWTILLRYDKISSKDHRNTKVILKLFAEYLSTLTLIIGGIGLIFQQIWGFPLLAVGLGLLLFSLLNLTGQYAELEKWEVFGFFLFLAITMGSLTFILIFL